MKKKVFIFTSVHNWNDTRIFYKEAVSLAKKYDVELHASAEFEFKEEKGVRIIGLPIWKRISDRKIIRKELWRRLKKTDAEIFHFHDPELIIMGIWLKLFKKKKVIYDVHEDYYTSILLKKWIPTALLRKFIAFLFSSFEKFSCIFFDAIIFAETYYKNKFSKKTIIRSIDILNYPILKKNGKIDGDKKFVKIIYTGGITEDRGAYNMINCFKELIGRGYKAKLYLVGMLHDENIISLIENDIKFRDLITIIGKHEFIDRQIIDKEYLNSDIGLALISSKAHYEKKLLTKFFEYMENQIPIIASNYEMWQSLISEVKCGICVDPIKPGEVADTIGYLIDNPDLARKMGRNGRKAIEDKYNWKFEELKLFKIYDGIS